MPARRERSVRERGRRPKASEERTRGAAPTWRSCPFTPFTRPGGGIGEIGGNPAFTSVNVPIVSCSDLVGAGDHRVHGRLSIEIFWLHCFGPLRAVIAEGKIAA